MSSTPNLQEAPSIETKCTKCGNPIALKPLTTAIFFKDALSDIFLLSKKLGTTLKTLLLQPQKVVEAYMLGQKHLFISPFKLLLFATAVSFFLFLTLEPFIKAAVFVIEEDKYGLLAVIVFVLLTKLFFYKTSLIKCVVFCTYLLSFIALCLGPVLLLLGLTSSNNLIALIYIVILLTYLSFNYIKVFKQHPLRVFVKVLFILILSSTLINMLLSFLRATLL